MDTGLLCDHHLCDPTLKLSTVLLLEITHQAAEENTKNFLNAEHSKKKKKLSVVLTLHSHLGAITLSQPLPVPSLRNATHTHLMPRSSFHVTDMKQTNACKAELKMAGKRRWPGTYVQTHIFPACRSTLGCIHHTALVMCRHVKSPL